MGMAEEEEEEEDVAFPGKERAGMVEVRGRLEVGRRQKMTSARELQKLVQVHCSVSEEYNVFE